jgi:antitoxin MazE
MRGVIFMGVAVSVSKWGTSLGVRIPSSFAKSTDIREGDTLDITLDGDRMILKKAEVPTTMQELYALWDGKPYELSADDRKWLKSPAIGKEIW